MITCVISRKEEDRMSLLRITDKGYVICIGGSSAIFPRTSRSRAPVWWRCWINGLFFFLIDSLRLFGYEGMECIENNFFTSNIKEHLKTILETIFLSF